MGKSELPTNLLEAARYFADEDVCIEFVAKLRWPDGPTCPRCEATEHSYLTSRKLWKCKTCKYQYSVKKGTIFEDSPIKLDKWLLSIWLIANSKNGISSHELARSVGITQKSAWFVLHRIRLAMRTGSFLQLDGTVEVDETWIGGKVQRMNSAQRRRAGTIKGGSQGKTVVVGAVERGGQVRAKIVPDSRLDTLQDHVYDSVIQGSTVYTDEAPAYATLRMGYKHAAVNHRRGEYARGDVHTNTIENFWSVLKRGLHGTYISVEPFHLFRYLDERVFTFNQREANDLGRFTTVIEMVSGRRLTWAALTGQH